MPWWSKLFDDGLEKHASTFRDPNATSVDRAEAEAALAKLGKRALPELEDALDWSSSETDRAGTAAALGEIGVAALPALIETFFTQEARYTVVRSAVTAALDRIDPGWRTSARCSTGFPPCCSSQERSGADRAGRLRNA